MTNVKERKRLALTANKMPEEIYLKLEKLGAERKLTPYIVSLIEREEQTNKLLEGLNTLVNNNTHLTQQVKEINEKINIVNDFKVTKSSDVEIIDREEIKEGKLDISDNIEGGIDEEIDEVDF